LELLPLILQLDEYLKMASLPCLPQEFLELLMLGQPLVHLMLRQPLVPLKLGRPLVPLMLEQPLVPLMLEQL